MATPSAQTTQETIAGTLEVFSAGLFSSWKRHFFQITLQGDRARLVQYASEADHAGGRPPEVSFDLLQVSDIVEPLDAPKSWFELWFSNGAVARLRAAEGDWATWVGNLLFACTGVMQRLASTLTTEPTQATPVGTLSKQLSRASQLRSVRYYAQVEASILNLLAVHPAIAAVLEAAGHPPADAPAAAPAVAAPPPPSGTHAASASLTPAQLAVISELSDAVTSETHARSSMIEDRIAHHMTELETNVKASHVGQVQTIATLAVSMDLLAGGMTDAVDKLAALGAHGADTAQSLAKLQTRVDAVGAKVEENALRAKSDVASLRGSVDNVERLLLQIAPKVVPVSSTKAATAAALRAAAAGGPSPAPGAPFPHHAVETLHAALTEHSSQVDVGLAHVITRQKALEASVKGIEGSVGALSHMLADVVRAMQQLSDRQEALCNMVAAAGTGAPAAAHGGGGGGSGRGGSGATSVNVAGVSSSPAAPPQPPARAVPQSAAPRRDVEPASPRSTRGFGDGEGAHLGGAALRERKVQLLHELSLAAGLDLTAAHTSVGASARLPATVRGRQDVKAIFEKLREVEQQLDAAIR
jgi:hypothetical protein